MLGSSSVYACACAFCFVLVHLFPLDCTCRGGSRGRGRLVRGGKLASLLEAVGLSFAEVRRLLGLGRRHIGSVWVGSQAYRHGRLSGLSGSCLGGGFRGSLGLTHSVWVGSGRVIEVGLGSGGYYQRWR